MSEQGIDIRVLSPQQLQSLGQSLEGDIQSLVDSMQALQQAAQRFQRSDIALSELTRQEEGKKMLVPLTDSLYARGTLGNKGMVLIDIGTGYFAEYTPEDGQAYCKRKIALLQESLKKIDEVLATKKQQHRQVAQVLQMKVAQAQQQQGGKGGAPLPAIGE